MIAHVVLLQPRADLSDAERSAALQALRHAAETVPAIRRARLGRRLLHGRPGYEQMMRQPFEFALIVELDDAASLAAYLDAPAHAALGHLFSTATAAALAYDFELEELTPDATPRAR